jgi:predicted amidohydrolase YtcJ
MKSLAALVLAIISGFALSPVAAKLSPADLVFKNGNVYTANDRQPTAGAVAVMGDRIIFVGSNIEAQKYVGKNTRVIDLGGKTMLPGLTDAHQHLSGVGFREMTLNLEGIMSLEEFLAKVKERIKQKQPGEWVTGRGWIETFWKPPVFPTRWDLDRVAPNNPVFLDRADGHGAVANSAALKIAGVDKNTASPFGGEISKDKQSGEPNGML